MHIDIAIPFWGVVIMTFMIGVAITFIISLFADNTGYLPDIVNAVLCLGMLLITIFVCIGMIIGKYVF